MSKAKEHLNLCKLTVKSKSPGKILTGALTEIYLDGKLLGGVTSFKFEVGARKIAKVTMELFTTLDEELSIDTVFTANDRHLLENFPKSKIEKGYRKVKVSTKKS